MIAEPKWKGSADVLAAGLLFLGTFCILAHGADRLGFYYDDLGFIATLPAIHTLHALWDSIRAYVPGRNLHILWQYLFFAMAGMDPVAHLAALHRIQSACDSLAVVLFYVLLRRFRLSVSASLMAATLFAFAPIHGQTHFWMSALPMNIVSTLWLLIVAHTSLSLAQGNRKPWIWAVDLIAFWCAALTYDQAVGALLVIAGARVLWVLFHRGSGRAAFVAMHAAHAMAVVTFLWLRLTAPAGAAPMYSAGEGLWHHLQPNIADAIRTNTGHVSWELHAGVAAREYRLAALGIALLFFLVAVWFLRIRSNSGPTAAERFSLLALTIAFWVAAYVPIWLWYPAPRHHYLPTLGSFCALAVLLDWLERVDTHRILAPVVLLGLSAVAGLSAAATLVESRYWQEAFGAKSKLIQGLRGQLAGKRALVLEGFPISDGPAMFITFHDALLGPKLLLPDVPLGAGFQGDLTATHTDAGIALGADPESASSPRLPDDDVLWVRFERFENGVLEYSIVTFRK